MTRAMVAATLVLVLAGRPARGDSCDCAGAKGLAPSSVDPQKGPSRAVLDGLLAGGATMAVTSYVLGVILAHDMPHSSLAVDGLPIVGPIVAAAQSPGDRNAPLLSVLAGATAMGSLVVAAVATDLAAQRRLRIAFGAAPNGCGVTMTLRVP
jgi:hypothetical protein